MLLRSAGLDPSLLMGRLIVCCRGRTFYHLNILRMNIFVAKLNYDTQSDDLRDAFSEFGPVTSSKVIMDKFTGQSRGFGFVEMEYEEDGRAAIDALNDTDLDGRTIVVKKAEPRKERSSSPSW
jgi:RNA recognition motif-containing protein